jgi:hypothetical protein
MMAFTSNLLWETPVDLPASDGQNEAHRAALQYHARPLHLLMAAYSARSPSLILPILANFRATSRDPGHPDRAIEGEL